MADDEPGARARRPGGLREFIRVQVGGDVRADVDRVIVGAFIVIRITQAVTVALALPRAISSASSAPIFLLVTIGVALFSMAMAVSCWREGRLSHRWGIPDVLVTLAALLVLPQLFPVEMWITSWVVWIPGYAIGTAAGAGGWVRRPRWAIGVGGLIGLSYFLVMAIPGGVDVWSLLANAASYPLFAGAAAWVAAYLRALAREADSARAAEALAVAELERERYRMLVHDASGVLRMLGDDSVPEPMHQALRQQAVVEAARMRQYLGDRRPHRVREGEPSTLGDVVDDAVQGFTDLPLEFAVDLGVDAPLAPEVADALRRAVVTVLHNVRRHAQAHQVVLHADWQGPAWSLSIADDGVGFDPQTQPFGYGLATQVLASMARHGVDVDIYAQPGQGTSIRFDGRTRDSAGSVGQPDKSKWSPDAESFTDAGQLNDAEQWNDAEHTVAARHSGGTEHTDGAGQVDGGR